MMMPKARRWKERPEEVVYPLSKTSEHPLFVIEGFVRDDIMKEYEKLPEGKPFEKGTVFLTSDAVPVVDMYVKISVVCKPVWNKEFGEYVSYALMGGRITKVKGPGRVTVVMSVTNMPAPEELDCGDWEVELVYVEGARFPWVMNSMRKAE